MFVCMYVYRERPGSFNPELPIPLGPTMARLVIINVEDGSVSAARTSLGMFTRPGPKTPTVGRRGIQTTSLGSFSLLISSSTPNRLTTSGSQMALRKDAVGDSVLSLSPGREVDAAVKALERRRAEARRCEIKG